MKSITHGPGFPEKSPASAPAQPGSISSLKIPALLFEDDDEEKIPPTSTTENSPMVAPASADLAPGSAPATLTLMSRAPRSVYAHWAISEEQKRSLSEPGEACSLLLNVRQDGVGGPIAAQVHVTSEADHAFIAVPEGGSQYLAELCHSPSTGPAVTLATSQTIQTPPDSVSPDRTARYAALPLPVAGNDQNPTAPSPLLSPTPLPELSGPFSVPPLISPPKVSWIPILPLTVTGQAQTEQNVQSGITQELISALRNAGLEISEESSYRYRNDLRPFQTSDLEELLRLTMEQLAPGNSS